MISLLKNCWFFSAKRFIYFILKKKKKKKVVVMYFYIGSIGFNNSFTFWQIFVTNFVKCASL